MKKPFWVDPIVEEVRKAGDQIAKKYNYDLKKLYEHYRRLDRKHPELLVNFETAKPKASPKKKTSAKTRPAKEAESLPSR